MEEEDIFHSPEHGMVDDKDEANCEEKRRIGLMRAIVEKKDPACKDLDDLTLRRFLRARDLDVEKASSMFIKYLNWRKTFVPRGSISASDVPNEIAQKKMFIQGKDKQGRPISVVFGSKHFSRKEGVDEFKRFLVFALDKLCSRIPEGQDKFTIIGDLQGFGYCNTDIRGSLAAVTILQEYYPERLGKLFLVHVPYIFMKLWKIVYPFIDKNTRQKIVFVENNRLLPTLLEDIDENQIPDIYGGKMQLVPTENC